MNKKVLIVEDQFVEANDIQLMLQKAGYQVCGIARSVPSAQEMIEKEEPGLVLLDIFLKGKLTGIDLARQLKEQNIAFIYLSANSNEEVLTAAKATQPDGFLIKPFREKDLLITLGIAVYRHEHSMDVYLKKEKIFKEKMLSIVASDQDAKSKIMAIGKALQANIPFDYLTAGFNKLADFADHAVSLLRIGYDEYQEIGAPELTTITGLNKSDIAILAANLAYEPEPTLFNGEDFESFCSEPSLHQLFADNFNMQSCLTLSLQLGNGSHFVCCFYSKKSDTYNADHTGSLNRLQDALTKGVENSLALKKQDSIAIPKAAEGFKPAANARVMPGFEGIVGKSHLLLNVFDLITQVAPSDASVLILGESGTGKERIADCIHNLSPRKNKQFVKVNCAALPSSLIESELFGHEKGSFTGALEKRIGKFEKADKGSIFLDEIGEMPIDIQAKMLRVLQERCFERVGADNVTKIDVRIIAATNRNLEKEVAEGRFRLDLYYRLNVYPIELPALRERVGDIPALAAHFIKHYGNKAGKKITGLSDPALKSMMAYNWPGNIRELENLIERGVLLAKGEVIENISIPGSQKRDAYISQEPLNPLKANERDVIINALKKCNGRIFGVGGAAELLNLPPSTLTSKMKRLGIRKEFMG
jgi:DNA-binding NtrC family response regulator